MSYNKRILVIATVLAVMAMHAVGQTLSVNQASNTTNGLPVLRVNFNGSFSRNMEYVNGTMQLTATDGSVIAMAAKVKTRGATASHYMMKPSFNLKLRTPDYVNELDTPLLGMRSCSSWILDAMAIDRICMRNRVVFDIWNDFSRLPYETEFDGRNGTEGRFVEVYINDTYYGIYCLNDRINRKLLDLKKVKDENGQIEVRGVLYKSGTQDIADQNNPCYNADSSACVIAWHDAWELSYPEDYGSAAAWAPLQDAILNGNTTAYVKKYFYLDNLVDYHLLVMAMSIADNWGNKNHYLSIRNINKDINATLQDDADRRRFVLTPWDLDTSLGGRYDGEFYDGNYSDWPIASMNNNAFYPLSAVLGDSEYKAKLKQRWIELRHGALSTDSVNAKLERYRDLFINTGAWERMVTHYEAKSSKPKYVIDLAREISLIEGWYAARFNAVDEYFGVHDGIENLPEENDTLYYDLLGRPIGTEISLPGTYIRGGKVVLIVR